MEGMKKEKDSDGREAEINDYEEWRCHGSGREAEANVPPSLCLTEASGDFRDNPLMEASHNATGTGAGGVGWLEGRTE